MKPLRLAYSRVPNMGDLLNEYIFERVFQVPFAHCDSARKYEVTGIGSFLDVLFTGPEKERTIKSQIRNIIYSHCSTLCITWGTGFLEDYSSKRTGLIRNNVSFLAVRGEKTQNCIESIIGQHIAPVLGDGGILAPFLFDQPIPKKYEIGFIPHFREKSSAIVSNIMEKYPKLHLIDLQLNPIQVIEEIASCEYIYSSSLHGLIIADAFRIPNQRIYLTDAPLGGSFKFDDYYSAYDVENPPCVITKADDIPTLNMLIDNYKITDNMINKMQSELYKCMRDYLSKRF